MFRVGIASSRHETLSSDKVLVVIFLTSCRILSSLALHVAAAAKPTVVLCCAVVVFAKCGERMGTFFFQL